MWIPSRDLGYRCSRFRGASSDLWPVEADMRSFLTSLARAKIMVQDAWRDYLPLVLRGLGSSSGSWEAFCSSFKCARSGQRRQPQSRGIVAGLEQHACGGDGRAGPPFCQDHLPSNSGIESPIMLMMLALDPPPARAREGPPPLRLEKRALNDADDAGQGGQHHQRHWGLVSPICGLPAPPPTCKNWPR